MMKLPYQPGTCEWLHKPGDSDPIIAVAEADGPLIRIYEGRGTKEPVHEISQSTTHENIAPPFSKYDVAQHLVLRCVLLSDPSTNRCCGPQPKHVSNRLF